MSGFLPEPELKAKVIEQCRLRLLYGEEGYLARTHMDIIQSIQQDWQTFSKEKRIEMRETVADIVRSCNTPIEQPDMWRALLNYIDGMMSLEASLRVPETRCIMHLVHLKALFRRVFRKNAKSDRRLIKQGKPHESN